MKIKHFRGQDMFKEITEYISSRATGVDFDNWTYLTALILPNIKSQADLPEHLKELKLNVITSSDDICTELKLDNELAEIGREYTELANILLTSLHGACVKKRKGVLELKPVWSDVERTHHLQAGKDAPLVTPGFDNKHLKAEEITKQVTYTALKSQENPANSLPVWIFWHPKQAEIIFNYDVDKGRQRVVIQGPYGSGKTQVLMGLALKAVTAKKKVWFWSMLEEANSLFNEFVQDFCVQYGMGFCKTSLNMLANVSQIKMLQEQCDYLLLDEVDPYRDEKILRFVDNHLN